MIKRDCDKYLTGEKPSTWVYDKVHTVRQLGTKRFPEGVLLMNIYSWVCEECLVPVHEREAAPEETKPEETKPVEVKPAPEQKPAETKPAEVKPADETKPEEVKPADETKPEENKPEETKPEEQKPGIITEQVKGDSIKSHQNFKSSYNRFSIGVRGGASSLLHNLERGNWTCGGDVVLDLQYAHYWTDDSRPVDLGIITGIGIGYSQSGMKTNVNSMDTILDKEDLSFPLHVEYTVKADEVKEQDGQLQLEIPLMFSLIHENGLFFNFGPKFMLPVYTPYQQTISNNENTYINAYFREIGVNVKNEVITGILAENQFTTKADDYGNKFTINIMLGAELGYEWILKSGNSLGLGAYANYSVYNGFKNNSSSKPLIEVTPPVGSSNAEVTVLPATQTYAKSLGFFDAGVKVAYHFDFPKKHQSRNAKLF